MPHHAIAKHLRRIADRLDGHPQCHRITQLADGFDALVTNGTDPIHWHAERDRLLSAAEEVVRVFERSEQTRFRELAGALKEFAVTVDGLSSQPPTTRRSS